MGSRGRACRPGPWAPRDRHRRRSRSPPHRPGGRSAATRSRRAPGTTIPGADARVRRWVRIRPLRHLSTDPARPRRSCPDLHIGGGEHHTAERAGARIHERRLRGHNVTRGARIPPAPSPRATANPTSRGTPRRVRGSLTMPDVPLTGGRRAARRDRPVPGPAPDRRTPPPGRGPDGGVGRADYEVSGTGRSRSRRAGRPRRCRCRTRPASSTRRRSSAGRTPRRAPPRSAAPGCSGTG